MIMVYVDIDNTLLFNPFDLDLPKNRGKSIQWFEEQTKACLKTTIINWPLVEWINKSSFPVSFLTNRGITLQEFTEEQMFVCGLDLPVIYCDGRKSMAIETIYRINSFPFFIDNAKKYNPHYLVTDFHVNGLDHCLANYIEKEVAHG